MDDASPTKQPHPDAWVTEDDDRPWPQPGLTRLPSRNAIGLFGHTPDTGPLAPGLKLGPDAVFMMGDNPALPRMPERPTLMDYYRLRFENGINRHMLNSAKKALDDGHDEKVVLACLLHDLAQGGLVRSDHGYWAAQMLAPYVSEEISWAIKYHQSLRYFADESVGYNYPDAYYRYFGKDYKPPEYIRRDAEEARNHKWYMTSRLITLLDVYVYQTDDDVDPDLFTDIIGRHFRTPEEGLGMDASPAAHMWRAMIWPNNFL